MLMLMTKLGHNIMPDIDKLRDEVLNVKDTVIKKRVKKEFPYQIIQKISKSTPLHSEFFLLKDSD